MRLGLLVLTGIFALGAGVGCATGNPATTTTTSGAGGGGGGGEGGSDGECAGLPDGSPCGDRDDFACNKPDSCLQGRCVVNNVAEGEPCGTATDTDCDPADTCDGMGACTERMQPEGAPCGDSTDNGCTAPDTCDGQGVCLPNHEPLGFLCGDNAMNACTAPDSCDGQGVCQPHDEPAGTPCGDATDDDCTSPDRCDGAGVCDPNHAASGTACGDQSTTECSAPDSCDGNGQCDPNHALMGVACGDASDTDCTNPDSCTGLGECFPNHAFHGAMCDDCPAGSGMCDQCASGVCLDACIPPIDSLTTTTAGGVYLNGAMFDIRAKEDITISRLSVNLRAGSHDVSIWYVAGGMAGHETTQGDWTLVGTVNSLASNNADNTAPHQLTEIPLDLTLSVSANQTYGIYVHTTGNQWYTDTSTEGAIYVQNEELEIRTGIGKFTTPFSSFTATPRVFNGLVAYEIDCP